MKETMNWLLKVWVVTWMTLLCISTAQAQYWNGQDSIFGNEWIEFDQDYYKLRVTEDGIYRLDYQTLLSQGVPVNAIAANRLQMWNLGEEKAIYTTTDDIMVDGDYILFCGEKNKGQFDTHLYPHGLEDQLNPEYSMFNDTAAYFITFNDTDLGKRLEKTNPVTNTSPPEPYFLDRLKVVHTDHHVKYCKDVRCYESYSVYDKGQGYANAPSRGVFPIYNQILEPAHYYKNGPTPNLYSRVTANFNTASNEGELEVYINDEEIYDDKRSGIDLPYFHVVNAKVDQDLMTNPMEVTITGSRNDFDRYAVGVLELEYPREFIFDNADYYELTIGSGALAKNITIQEFNGGDQLGYFDLSGLEYRELPKNVNENYILGLNPSNEDRELILFNLNTVKNIGELERIRFKDYSNLDPNFIIISHQAFFNDNNGDNPVAEYSQYRSSVEGGNYSSQVFDIEDLYNQFSYGIRFHPSSVRHFLQWMKNKSETDRFVFVIGKGVENEAWRKTTSDRRYVPTFGLPGADMLMASDPFYNPLYPIGRIPVLNTDEINSYLEKVKTHESFSTRPQTIEDRFWTKKGVHLSGGDLDESFELMILREGLDRMKNIIDSNHMGLNIETFQKKTTGTVTISDNEGLTQLVNDGVSLVTYFGHSFVNLLDFQIIDDVKSFKPTEQYNVFMGMGCYAGQMYHPTLRSYSEQWTLADRRGSVLFIANSSAGFIPSLEKMGKTIYSNYGSKFFGESVGLSIRDAIQSFIDENRKGPNSLEFDTDTELAFSLNICGDPSIKLQVFEYPDYIIDPETVSLVEDIVTDETDSITIQLEVYNLGQSLEDSMWVRVDQVLPDGSEVQLKEEKVSTPFHTKRYSIRIPSLGQKAVGFNKINISLDSKNDIDEQPAPEAENNNDLKYNGREFCFFVTSEDARPIHPENFSISSEAKVELIASTSDAAAVDVDYLIQIDTTEEFDSGFLQETKVNRRGGLVKWVPSINYENEKVYYWRITPDSIGRGNYAWRGSSFVHIDNHPKGWNQSHYFQYLYNSYDSIELNTENYEWEFVPEFLTFIVKNVNVIDATYKRPAIIRGNFADWEYYANSPRGNSSTTTVRSGVYVTLYDPVKLEAVLNPSPGLYNSLNTSGGDIKYYAFDTETYRGRVDLMNFMENDIPDKHYVFFMTIQEPGRIYGAMDWANDVDSTINKSIFDVLEARGATQSRMLSQGDVPYVYVYQEGNPNFDTKEQVGNTNEQFEQKVTLAGKYFEGYGNSVEIGPASEWTKFEWDRQKMVVGEDVMMGKITGLRSDGTTMIIQDSFHVDEIDLSGVDAQEFPHLQLHFYAMDTISKSIPQLNHWRITYKSLPDLAIDTNDDFVFYNDTLQQGEDLSMKISFENVGDFDVDSVWVRYNIVDDKNNIVTASVKAQNTIPGQRVLLDYTRETSDLSGDYRLIVDVNPGQAPEELNAWNNSIIQHFHVVGDDRNPLLDVTFDGVHILDGDLVSAKPEILIRLTDENKYLLLDDTSLFNLQIKYPSESQFRDISMADPEVEFNPASSGDNEATISIKRKFPVDGIYTLKINGSDKSGNESGELDYQTRFEIVNESSISEVLNYPNPFSTSTQFVYTLTGEESPTFFKIQIMTVSGKVVREITSAELGELRIGKHMTDYRYNGTDEYGEPLANGVYLYRVVARDNNGDQLKKRDVGISDYFKKGWGKMVILR